LHARSHLGRAQQRCACPGSSRAKDRQYLRWVFISLIQEYPACILPGDYSLARQLPLVQPPAGGLYLCTSSWHSNVLNRYIPPHLEKTRLWDGNKCNAPISAHLNTKLQGNKVSTQSDWQQSLLLVPALNSLYKIDQVLLEAKRITRFCARTVPHAAVMVGTRCPTSVATLTQMNASRCKLHLSIELLARHAQSLRDRGKASVS